MTKKIPVKNAVVINTTPSLSLISIKGNESMVNPSLIPDTAPQVNTKTINENIETRYTAVLSIDYLLSVLPIN
jgi:hypothetical protein